MKYIYLALILIFAYIIFELVIFYYKYTHLHVLTEHKQEDAVLGRGEKLRYIAAGDSTAVGLGATSVENTYTYKIASELAKSHEVTYKNVGVVGAKTSDVVNAQLEEIISFNPDLVTISIGGNDATHLVSSEQVLNNLNLIINRITTETNAKVYITNTPNFTWAKVLPWAYRKILEFRDALLNKKIAKLETDRVHIVDIHDFGWASFPDISVTNAADNFHPNDVGYQNWTNAFLDKINKH